MENTGFEKKEQRKMYSMDENETEFDIVLVGKNNRKYLNNTKAIPWKLQHRVVETDLDKRKLKKVMKNKQTIRRKVWKLKENNMKARFKSKKIG